MIKNYLLAFFMIILLPAQAQHEIWGTLGIGGENGYGYIYKCDAAGDNFTIVHQFEGTDGLAPGGLLAASNNKLYGVTTSGGQAGTAVEALFQGGVLFEIDLATEEFTVLKHFYIDNEEITGMMPMGHGQISLTEVSPGIIYGNIRSGNSDRIFSYNVEEDALTSVALMPTFNGGAMNTPHGMRLTGALYLAEDGYLYGSTAERSQCPIPMPLAGTIVRLDPDTGVITLPYIASCTPVADGFIYESNFVAHGDELYSVALEGGAFNKGVIYSYNPVTDTYTNKFDFDGETKGWEPGTLMKATNGKLYGTTTSGGLVQQNMPFGCGILYEYDPETNDFTKLHDFLFENGWIMAVGANPYGPMIEGSNGKLYGVARNGVYEFDPETNEIVAKGRFDFNYQNGYPSITAVCRKPIYAQTSTSLQACPGEPFSYDIQSPNAETVTWYHDNLPDDTHTGTLLAFENVTPADAGEWKAVLENECGMLETHIMTLTTTAEPSVMADGNTLTVDTAAETYQWVDCSTNANIDGATEADYTPAASGSYAVTITTGSCSTTSDCYEYVLMGLQEPKDSGITLYPNPAGSEITLGGAQEMTGHVMNLLGQHVMTISEGANDIAKLPSGTYVVVVAIGESIIRQKFVKR